MRSTESRHAGVAPAIAARRAQQRRRRRIGLAVAGLFIIALVVAVIDSTDWLTDAFTWDKVGRAVV